MSKCFYRAITFAPQYLHFYKRIFQSRNILYYNRCADFHNLHEVSKKKRVKDIAKVGADKQTFPFVKDGVSSHVTVKEYFQKEKKIQLK